MNDVAFYGHKRASTNAAAATAHHTHKAMTSARPLGRVVGTGTSPVGADMSRMKSLRGHKAAPPQLPVGMRHMLHIGNMRTIDPSVKRPVCKPPPGARLSRAGKHRLDNPS